MINILYLHAGAEMYGADKVMLDLIKGLDKEIYNPYVILPTEGVLVDKLREADIDVEVVPYPIMRRKYFNPKGIFQYFCGLIKYSNIIVKRAKQKNINIVHTNTAATLEGCFVRHKLKIPQLWDIHEIIVNPKFMYKFTSKIISKYADVTITVSEAAKNHLNASGYFSDNAVKVIYNGVDSMHFSPDNECEYLYEEWNIPRDVRIVGMVGRVNSWKGQGDFLEAANMLMEKYADLYTVLVGGVFEGEEWREKELADKIEKSPYRDRIINMGYRTDSKAIYKLFDVFVLPSTNPDPLPTVVLEAMSTGKPVVGYRHGGVCEMVKENYNGLFANVREPKDLAKKIDILLENDQLRKEMGENSRKRLVEKFSMSSYIRNYSEAYNSLVDSWRSDDKGTE